MEKLEADYKNKFKLMKLEYMHALEKTKKNNPLLQFIAF